jgi:hypothetical protein
MISAGGFEMFSLSNRRVMVSLLCALVPAVVACGGGDGGADATTTEPGDEPVMDEAGGSGGKSSSSKGGSSSSSSEAGTDATSSEAGTPSTPAEAGAPGVDEMPVEGDTEAPTIVTTLPLDGATGVKSNSAIEIQFSEPMDTASVEAAYQSADLPPEAVTFAWNDDATWLTIVPNEDLEYASGADPAEVLAKGYVLTLASTAADPSGNTLADDATLSFTTLREITVKLLPIPELSGHVVLEAQTHSVTIQAGDTLGNDADRGLMSFDLSSVPETYQLLSALIVANQSTVTHDPFTDLSLNADPAKLMLFHRSHGSRVEGASVLPGVATGMLSNSAKLGSRSVTVMGAVSTDLKARVERNNLTQFGLQFPAISDNDADIDKVTFTGVALQLNYFTP